MNKKTPMALCIIFVVWISNVSLVFGGSESVSEHTGGQFLPSYQDPQTASSINPWLSGFRVLIGLIIVIGLMYWLRKLLEKKPSILPQGKYISLIDGIGLGPNKGIYLAKLDNKCFLLGITEHQINLISELDIEALGEIVEEQSWHSEVSTSDGKQDFQNFLELQLERLKGISSKNKSDH